MGKKVDRFEELEVWQESTELAVTLYKHLKNCKDFGMRDQMQRAVVSIASNIAEGFDRQSQKEFIQFLYIARGSCAEVRTQLHIAAKVGILQSTEAETLKEQTRKISAMLYNLIQYRKKFT
ncbi:MAG: four helix bundle protein [Cyclobacteriaceae bacterium]